MVTQEEEYEGPSFTYVVREDTMTFIAQLVITVQLREPLTVQTYLQRVVVTTLISRKIEYDTKAVPWVYQTCIMAILSRMLWLKE